MTDCAEIVARYRQLRKIGMAINNTLVRTLAKDVLQEGGRKLGICRGGTLVFGSEDEMTVLMDYCIHDVWRDGMNALQRYASRSPAGPGSDEMRLLHGMLRARYSIFLVERVVPGAGVEVRDIFRSDRMLVVDMGFAQTAQAGVSFASRLIPMGEFWMTGGAALLVHEALDRIRNGLAELFGRQEPDWDGMPPEQQAEFVAVIVRACLECGEAAQIRYEQPREEADGKKMATRSVGGRRRVGRNEPCPCGSGKKYKKCCGR